jgi:CHRD domain
MAAAALALAAMPAFAAEQNFQATLTGATQIPDPTSSKATGEFKLTVHDGEKKISYTLTVTDLQNAYSAELHLGGPSTNGPGVVKLFPAHGATARKGPFTGVLAEGTITAADLTGPMLGSPLSDLVYELRDGKAYVNIHTNDGSTSQKPGPGNYRTGEIRGQIEMK